ncbi:hypothetical protein ABZ671_01560 [Micromonospora sp. NPDC006766]|uniref:hypothetical protein n=1 Tax=Micromonospora sp. NPDC006766 TaxID=3154778 RepID=UPI0033E39E6E
MTDEDVVAQAATLVEANYRRTPARQPHHKDAFTWRVRGRRAVELMQALEPLMGKRRREQIGRALAAAKPGPNRKPYLTEIAEMAEMKGKGAHRAEIATRFNVRPKTVNALLRGDWRPMELVHAHTARIAEIEDALASAVGADTDIAWLAGILEGEGCFSTGVALRMTDRDVVSRAAGLMGATGVNVARREQEHWNDIWYTRIYGERARQLAERISPALGARRQRQVEALLVAGRTAHGQPRRTGSKRPTRLTVPPERLSRNIEIARRMAAGESGPVLAQEYGMTHQNVYYIASRYRDQIVCPSG